MIICLLFIVALAASNVFFINENKKLKREIQFRRDIDKVFGKAEALEAKIVEDEENV